MIILRPATLEDSALLFQWRNDPVTVGFCEQARGVTEEEHAQWLRQQLDFGPEFVKIFMAQVEGVGLIGTGRIEYESGDTARLSYTIAPVHRGHGLCLSLLSVLIQQAYGMGYTHTVCHIQRQNVRSLTCARKAGIAVVRFFD